MLEWLFGKRKKKPAKADNLSSPSKTIEELPHLQEHKMPPAAVFPAQTPAGQSSGKMTPEQARRFAEALSIYLHDDDDQDNDADHSIP